MQVENFPAVVKISLVANIRYVVKLGANLNLRHGKIMRQMGEKRIYRTNIPSF